MMFSPYQQATDPSPPARFETVIVGGGPAGVSPLIAASRAGALDRMLLGGVAIVERGAAIGAGKIGAYAIRSDSTAETILSCLHENAHPALMMLQDHSTAMALRQYGRESAPLSLVGAFMGAVGGAIQDIVASYQTSSTILGHEAIHSRQTAAGGWETRLRRICDGREHSVLSRFVVLATGGDQPAALLAARQVAGISLQARYPGKLLHSGDALTTDGLNRIVERLSKIDKPRVAIIGSSSSALACAVALLDRRRGLRFEDGAISVLHRRALRVWYPSAAEALAEGYDEFGIDDICPVSGFVYRFAGFRLEARELVMAARGLGGRSSEPRVHLHRILDTEDAASVAVLDSADVIIVALGYRPRGLTMFSARGERIILRSDGPEECPMVDEQCRVLDCEGSPIAGVLGIGLASGHRSSHSSGGEPSFTGQTNSIWQWQNGVGATIAEHALASEAWPAM